METVTTRTPHGDSDRRMSGAACLVSIVIRCRNAAADLEVCLERIRNQQLPPNWESEVVVVDNESTDTTAAVAGAAKAKIVELPAKLFSWGRALNLGISATKGEYIILLSADAHPADDHWLEQMLIPFADPVVAVVYGRQLPRAEAPIDERSRLIKMFPDSSKAFHRSDASALPTGEGMIVSNACACIRRDLWEQLPYDEEIRGGEEGVWTAEVIARGYISFYQASARVFHSHRDSISRFAWREWELYEKQLDLCGTRTTLFRAMWRSGAMLKRRVRNCFQTSAPLSCKVEGLLRLPAEIAAFLALALLPNDRKLRIRLRPIFWG